MDTYNDNPMGGSDRIALPSGKHNVKITQVYPDGNLELTGAKGTITLPRHRVKQVYHNATNGKSTVAERTAFADALDTDVSLAILVAPQVGKDGKTYNNVVEAKLK